MRYILMLIAILKTSSRVSRKLLLKLFSNTFGTKTLSPNHYFISWGTRAKVDSCGQQKNKMADHRLPKLEISHIKNLPYKVLQNLVIISLTTKLKIKFTYLEFALCLSLVCILGTIGGVLEGFFAIVLKTWKNIWKLPHAMQHNFRNTNKINLKVCMHVHE